MFVILAALHDEIRILRSELEVDVAFHMKEFAVFTGNICGKKVALVRTGVGEDKMRNAAKYCAENLKPTLMMNVGYSGGLDPKIQVADLVISTEVIYEKNEKHWTVDPALVTKAADLAKRSDIRFHVGKTVTVDEPITTPHDKAFVGTNFEAISVDMESTGLADVAVSSGIPFMVVRSVLDSMDEHLASIPKAAIKTGEVDVGEFLKYLKKNPKDLIDMPRLSYLANQARVSMTNFIKEWIRHE